MSKFKYELMQDFRIPPLIIILECFNANKFALFMRKIMSIYV